MSIKYDEWKNDITEIFNSIMNGSNITSTKAPKLGEVIDESSQPDEIFRTITLWLHINTTKQGVFLRNIW